MKEQLKPYATQIASAAIMLVLCAGAFLAWNEFVREPNTDVTEHAEEIKRLTDQLAASKTEKDEMQTAYTDSMESHDAVLMELLADTNQTTEINQRYDEVRNTHRNLSADSAAALGRHRISIEPEYRKRFDYTY